MRRVNDELRYDEGQKKVILYNHALTEKKILREAKIVFCTDRDLYTLICEDKDILDYMGTVIVDEANLKNIYSDMIISSLKKLMEKREHLKLLLLCTSLDKYSFETFFSEYKQQIKKIKISQSNFPISIKYKGPSQNEQIKDRILTLLREIEAKISKKKQKAKIINQDPYLIKEANARHIIIFLSDAKIISRTFNDLGWLMSKEKGGLTNLNKKLTYQLFEAHGGINFRESGIFTELDDNNKVKIILASKVLETSITIEDVGFVVDFGQEKAYKFNSKIGVQTNICSSVR